MWSQKSVQRVLALSLIVLIGAVLAYALRPYFKAFLSAFILYVVFRPLYAFLTDKARFKKSLAALAVIVISFFVVLIPVSILLSVIINEAQEIAPQALAWLNNGPLSGYWFYAVERFDLTSQLSNLGSAVKDFLFGALTAVSNQFLNYLITYFLLYFLLVADTQELKEKIYGLVPFSRTNTIRLATEFRKVTYTTLFTSGIIALAQGCLMTVGFLIFGLPGAFLWGFVTLLASFIAIIGAPIVWAPVSLVVLLSGQPLIALGFFLWGMIVVSGIDNVLRPLIQRRMGQIHPLLSLLGIIIGISLFGLIGIVLGPLILSYFLLTLQMFKEEYIE